MRRLVLLFACAALLAPAGVLALGRPTPVLRTTSARPLAVQGVHFRPAERVTVRVAVGSAIRMHVVRATAAGTFTTTFTAVVLERCSPFAITASGSRGSVATLRPRPFVDCNPF